MKTFIEKELLNKSIEEEFEGVCVYDVSPSMAVHDFQEIVNNQPVRTEAEIKKEIILDFMKMVKDWQEDIHDNEYDAVKYDFIFERMYEMVNEVLPKESIPEIQNPPIKM